MSTTETCGPQTGGRQGARLARLFPFADLEHALRIRSGKPAHPPRLVGSCTNCSHDFCFSTKVVAQVLGVDRRQIYRWREIGLTEVQADNFATAADLHPVEVWAGLWEATAGQEVSA